MKQEKAKCIENKTFLEVFLNGAEIGQKDRFIDHIFSCPKCRLKFETLNALRRELRRIEEEFPCAILSPAEEKAFRKMAKARLRENSGKPPKDFFNSGRLRLFRLLSASAAIVIFCLAGYLLFNSIVKQKSFRAPHNGNVHLMDPKGTLKAVPSLFRWSRVENADAYNFKIIGDDLQTIYEDYVSQTSLLLSEETRNKIKEGKVYIWSIEAIGDDGGRISFSQEHFIIGIPKSY